MAFGRPWQSGKKELEGRKERNSNSISFPGLCVGICVLEGKKLSYTVGENFVYYLCCGYILCVPLKCYSPPPKQNPLRHQVFASSISRFPPLIELFLQFSNKPPLPPLPSSPLLKIYLLPWYSLHLVYEALVCSTPCPIPQ